MDHYEELGVASSASAEEIRDAWRNLVRLLHPDHQQDPVLKRLAECQMKRINQVHAVLSDPERRRRYDAMLAKDAGEPPVPLAVKPPPPRVVPRRNHPGTFLWLATALAGVAAIAWYMTQDAATPSPRLDAPPPAQAVAAPPAQPPAAAPAPSPRTAELAAEITSLRAQLESARAQRDLALEQAARRPREPQRAVNEPIPPPPVTEPAAVAAVLPAKLPEEPPKPGGLAGAWVFPRATTVNSQRLYAPEYIETFIEERDGAIRGRYRARYRVTDKAISPDVAFAFEGKARGGAISLPWTGAAGAQGNVRLKLVSDNSLEVVWTATRMGTELGLGSGTAVLVRQRQP